MEQLYMNIAIFFAKKNPANNEKSVPANNEEIQMLRSSFGLCHDFSIRNGTPFDVN